MGNTSSLNTHTLNFFVFFCLSPALPTLRELIFSGIRFCEFSRKLIPRENFQTLWIHEILGFLPKSPRKMKEIR